MMEKITREELLEEFEPWELVDDEMDSLAGGITMMANISECYSKARSEHAKCLVALAQGKSGEERKHWEDKCDNWLAQDKATCDEYFG